MQEKHPIEISERDLSQFAASLEKFGGSLSEPQRMLLYGLLGRGEGAKLAEDELRRLPTDPRSLGRRLEPLIQRLTGRSSAPFCW